MLTKANPFPHTGNRLFVLQAGSEFPIKLSSAAFQCIVGVFLIFTASGCTTSRFTQAAGELGSLTKSAAEQQNQRLSAVAADEKERYHQSLADTKANLKITDCAQTLAGDTPDTSEPRAKPFKRCRIVERRGPSDFAELVPDTRFENISALNAALVGYAEGLVQLAADASKDSQTFTGSVNKLASSLAGLEGAVRKVSGTEDSGAAAKLTAIGSLVAKAGNMYFAARRQAVLKQLIIEGDPLVQRAVAILGDADSQLDLYDRVPLYSSVIDAQRMADEALAAGNPPAIRATQDKLFSAVEKFNGYRVDRSRFAAISAAHSKLVEAARSGATVAELQQAIIAVLDVASTVGETRKALEAETK